MKSIHPFGSNRFSLDDVDASPIHDAGMFSPVQDHRDADDLVEYLHEVDVCAEEDFWWDEEDRHDL